ncbi:MAG TPA: response regulator [Solirubrobacterales bacterium]|jgi:CheY-like chemotaxis protein|nr:response regulator [Solirubrobacterales bacterium]
MSDPVKILIVDDDRDESESLADLLNKSGNDLVCTAVQPYGSVEVTAKLIREQLDTDAPRLLLLDYRLADHQMANGRVADFRGGTVASHVRDEDPDLPIVLLTSEEKLHQWVERRPGMRQHFDWTLLKSSVAAKDHGVRAHAYLVDFALTWQRARGWPDDEQETWRRLGELMSAPPEGLEQFVTLEPKPPRGDVAGEILHWLLKRAHRLRGPLIDDASARVMLGLTPESFEAPEVQQWLQPARYEGGLKAFGRRWWTHLVSDRLAEACGGARPIEASERVRHLAATLSIDLGVEMCAWCKGERTLHACLLCRRATDAAHCLTPLGEPLPAWADPQVVCYRCVAEGRAAQLHFPPSAQEIVDALIEDRIQPPRE